MCLDPLSMTVMSTVISAGGQVMSGMAQQSQGKANAAALEQQAKYREEKAEFDAQSAARDFSRHEGRVKAQVAASGLSTASFSDVLNDDLSESKLRISAIKYGGAVDAANYRFQAGAARAAGDNAMFASIINAGSSVVGGFGKARQVSFFNSKAGVNMGSSPFSMSE